MTNHVHLIVTPRVESGLAATMKDVGQTYVDTSTGGTSARAGSMTAGTAISLLTLNVLVLRALRYVELNPGRAGIVERPEDYRWSSFRFHAFGERDDLIVPHRLYLALGNCTRYPSTVLEGHLS